VGYFLPCFVGWLLPCFAGCSVLIAVVHMLIHESCAAAGCPAASSCPAVSADLLVLWQGCGPAAPATGHTVSTFYYYLVIVLILYIMELQAQVCWQLPSFGNAFEEERVLYPAQTLQGVGCLHATIARLLVRCRLWLLLQRHGRWLASMALMGLV
jgi:hypothetical protein